MVGSTTTLKKLGNSFIPPYINGTIPTVVNKARNFGFIIDNNLSFIPQINMMMSSATFLLHNLKMIKPFLPEITFWTVVQTLMNPKLYYCNSQAFQLVSWIDFREYKIWQLALKLLCFHITPVLRELHWLPVRERIDFKILCMVYKALNEIGPDYLKAVLNVRNTTRLLHSTSSLHISPPIFSIINF